MFTVVIVKPVQRLLGQYESARQAEWAVQGFAVNNGTTEAWVFGPNGERIG